ncbi:hypothetical protein NFT50_003198 [Salmonella enterica]|nr:hypothetical protein [Salmonella enterica]EJH7440003.1 hypothetical protein [Salmonella enterica]EJH7879078.1 hypothetical protein [Salmonella enterica]EJI6712087.1 hypothetical protein [Salmonella enterica]
MVYFDFKKSQGFFHEFYKKRQMFNDKYLSEELLDLLNRWATDKKKRDYYTIIDELLSDIPLEEQVSFIEKWKDIIPELSNECHYIDPNEEPYLWSRAVRKGEIMVRKAIDLRLLNTTVWPELMSAAKEFLPDNEINSLLAKYDNVFPVKVLWKVIHEYIKYQSHR